MIYPSNGNEILGFDKLKNLLSGYTQSKYARDFFMSDSFCPNDQPELEMQRVEEFLNILENSFSFPSTEYETTEEFLENLHIEGFFLEIDQIQSIRLLVFTANSIIDLLKKNKETFPKLSDFVNEINSEVEIIDRIDSIIDEDGEIKNSASPELSKIRKEHSKVRRQLDREFAKTLKKYGEGKMLADNSESIRNGRRVLAVLAENKRSIKGLLVDESDTGKTSFIEPEETILLNNRMVELHSEERREIIRLLKGLSSFIGERSDFISAGEELLLALDIIRSKAILAQKMEAKRPEIIKERELSLAEAYHPILWLQNSQAQKVTVPYNITLDKKSRSMIISGPNAGGKSVCLKTLGLYQIMLQHGLLIPANSDSRIHLFEKVFIDIGDSQSVEDELSTYSSKLKSASFFIDHSNPETLVLIDEFGSGTDPSLGGAMAEAILKDIHRKGAFSVITTHYSNLKILADKTSDMINASMLFDEKELKPTFVLQQGKPGNSYTFYIAEKSGVPSKVIDHAKGIADEGSLNFEKMLLDVKKEKAALRKQNKDLETEDKKLKTMMRQLDKMNMDLDYQKKQMEYDLSMQKKKELSVMESKIRELIQSITQDKNPVSKANEELEAIRKEMKKLDEGTEEVEKGLKKEKVKPKILEGSKVKMISSSKNGIVQKMKGDKAQVVFGVIKMTVPIDDLEVIEETSTREKLRAPLQMDRAFNPEIDIRGMRAEEAVGKLETFIDAALINNADQVKVIHGIGSGALRKVVWKTMKSYRQFKNVEIEEDKYGGAGATIGSFI